MTTTMIIGNKNYSSWSLRAWLMAKKTPLAFAELILDLDVPEFYERIGDLSPSRTVPALHLDGDILWDSLAIGEALAERYPTAGLWPDDAGLRAFARCISAEMHASFPALRNAMPMNVRVTGSKVESSEGLRRDIERIKAIWAECRRRRTHDDGGLVGGFTIADAMFVPVALRFVTYGVELDAADRAYVDWCLSDPDVAEWIAAAHIEAHVIETEA